MSQGNTKKSKSLVSIIIPLSTIAFALFFLHQTRDYVNFESVKFPYTIVVSTIILFGIIGVFETKKWRNELKSRRNVALSENAPSRISIPNSKKYNPLFLVVLTALYAVFIANLHTVITTYLYIVSLRLVFRKVSLRVLIYDLAAIIFLFVIMHEILLIQLPSGKVEEIITTILAKVL